MDAEQPPADLPVEFPDVAYVCCPECGRDAWRFKGRTRYCEHCDCLIVDGLGLCPSRADIYDVLAPALRQARPPLVAKKGYRGPPDEFRYWGEREWIETE
jgi:hypothetical protein